MSWKETERGTHKLDLGSGVILVVTRRIHEEGWHSRIQPFESMHKACGEDLEQAKTQAVKRAVGLLTASLKKLSDKGSCPG